MRCFRYKKLLIPYIEGALDERTQTKLEQHLASCEQCRRELQGIRAISSALRNADAPAVEPANDLWAKVNSRIANESAPARPWLRVTQITSAAAAAALIAVIGINLLKPGTTPIKHPAHSAKPNIQIAEKMPEPAEKVQIDKAPASKSAQMNAAHKLPSLSKAIKEKRIVKRVTVAKAATSVKAKKARTGYEQMASAQVGRTRIYMSGKRYAGESIRQKGRATEHASDAITVAEVPAGILDLPSDAAARGSGKAVALSFSSQRPMVRSSSTFAKSAAPSAAPAAPAADNNAEKTDKKGNESVVDELNKTEGVHTAALFQYP